MAVDRLREDPEAEAKFLAAIDYLELLVPPADAKRIVARLRRAPTIFKKAKDVLRASGLPLLPIADPEVRRHVTKLQAKEAVSPLLLVRGRLRHTIPLTITDGSHRLCAAYHINEDVELPCRLVDTTE